MNRVARRHLGRILAAPFKQTYGPLLLLGSARSALTVRRFLRFLRVSLGSGTAGTAAMTGLPTLAARLGSELRILREAAFLIGHALPAFTTRHRGELPILRKTTLRAGHALPALTTGLSRQPPVLREAALLIRNRFTTHTCDLPLPLLVH